MGRIFTPVPCDTQRVLKKNRNKCDNNYLLLNKFLEGKKTNNSYFETQKSKEKLYKALKSNSQDLEPHVSRFEKSVKRLEHAGYVTELFTLQTDSRMVVGLGDTNALEVGLTLHPLYGFPYIPGSSLKGLCRSWLEIAEDTFENGNVLEGNALQEKINKESFSVFGSSDKNESENSQIGNVLFFDAIPAQSPKLDIDIMTPHYSDYYKNPDRNPPGDCYSPTPIKFLTVAKEQKFLFGLADRDKNYLNKAKKWLTSGLTELGIGAKTSSGYGYFLHPDVLEQRNMEQEKKREAAKSDLEKENEQIRKKEKKAKEQVEELSAEELLVALEKQIIDLISSNNPSEDVIQAYELWKNVYDENKKIELAKLFFKKQNKYMRKKLKYGKSYAKELKKYADN